MRRKSPPRARWFFSWLLLAAIVVCSCGGGQETEKAQEPTPGGPTPTPKPLSDLDFFRDIKQRRKDAVRVADFNEYRDTLTGSRVQWTGYVLHIVEGKDEPRQRELRIDMDPPETLFRHYDVFFFIPADVASTFTKDQEITFQGDIVEIKELAGTTDLVLTVHLTNAIIVE